MSDTLLHIGIVTHDIDKSVAMYRQLCPDIVVNETIRVAQQGALVCFLEFPAHNASSKIELLQPLAEDSPLAKFLTKRGEGLHHICFGCDNLADKLAALKSDGFRLIDETPRIGALGKPVAFVHPKSAGGTLIEYEEE